MERVDYQSLIIQDILNLEIKGELDLKPWYQRRSVWNSSQKSYLINTLFERKPIPAIYIRHSLDLDKGKSLKEVVDGQQRTNSIIEFCKDAFSAHHPDSQKRIKFSQLSHTQKQNFLLTAIPVGYLLGATDPDVIDIFARINSVAKTLNDQERRNALYSGEFKQFCVGISVSRTNFWKEYHIFTGNDIARMNEIQFMSDIVINLLDGLTDYSSKKITDRYKEYDESFPQKGEIFKRVNSIFDTLINIEPDSIRETIFSRQPLLFSLFIALDSHKKIKPNKIEKALFDIDKSFNSDVPLKDRLPEDIAFYNACTASTQRIGNRQIRNDYIVKHFQ